MMDRTGIVTMAERGRGLTVDVDGEDAGAVVGEQRG
jgi:hypothetical protein